VVVNCESGYLVPERDVDALAERLEFLICYPHTWGQMGYKGRKHIEKNYDVVTQVKRLEEIYDTIAKGRQEKKKMRIPLIYKSPAVKCQAPDPIKLEKILAL